MESLKGKVAVITGGADGIGRASAKLLSSKGSRIIIADVDEERAEETLKLVRESGGKIEFIKTDVTKLTDVEKMIDFAVEKFGSIDVLFNNAGIAIVKPLLEHDPEKDFKPVLDVNLYGVYNGILAGARKMKELGVKGVIINTASGYAFMAPEGMMGYHVSKTAVLALTRASALELSPHDIRVLSLVPGWANTKIVEPTKEAGNLDNVLNELMRKKLLEPEEIAQVVAFMASDESSAMNGSAIHADDGYGSFKAHWN